MSEKLSRSALRKGSPLGVREDAVDAQGGFVPHFNGEVPDEKKSSPKAAEKDEKSSARKSRKAK